VWRGGEVKTGGKDEKENDFNAIFLGGSRVYLRSILRRQLQNGL
jgi:hypothetical protein